MEPRRDPAPGPHVLLLYGLASGEVQARCTCGEWQRTFSGGHNVEDYVRLEAMHAPPAATAEGELP
jgi:hypothetical protein